MSVLFALKASHYLKIPVNVALNTRGIDDSSHRSDIPSLWHGIGGVEQCKLFRHYSLILGGGGVGRKGEKTDKQIEENERGGVIANDIDKMRKKMTSKIVIALIIIIILKVSRNIFQQTNMNGIIVCRFKCDENCHKNLETQKLKYNSEMKLNRKWRSVFWNSKCILILGNEY